MYTGNKKLDARKKKLLKSGTKPHEVVNSIKQEDGAKKIDRFLQRAFDKTDHDYLYWRYTFTNA